MRDALTCGQIARWNQFLNQVPIGERRQDLRNAQLIAFVRATSGARDVDTSDHVMDFYPRPPDTTPITQKLRTALQAIRGDQ